MPDQDRKPSFIHTLSQDPGAGVRCPRCPGFGVTFQADCVCCGREVAARQDSKPQDLADSVKALSIKTEVSQVYSIPQCGTRSVAQEISQVSVPACPRTSNERHRSCNVPVLRSYSSFDQRPGAGTRDGVGSLGVQLAGGGSRSAISIYQQPQYVVQSSSSRRGTTNVTRGGSRGAGRGANSGAHHDFKGVRTRKGVKGFLVEIRPPKWKKTIWLGTYNTSVEAAGAYDAGVFYTKKSNTKYNFHSSEGAFPPLPPHLQLDSGDNIKEIKLFVQHQARAAARRMGDAAMGTPQPTLHREAVENNPVAASTDANSLHEPTSSESCLTGGSVSVNADPLTSNNSCENFEIDSEFHIPMDLDYLGLQCLHETAEETEKNMFLAYTNYLSQQGGPDHQQLLPEEDDHFTTS